MPIAYNPKFGAHSPKSTALSWAANADFPLLDRTLLGGHVPREYRSMITYSRDALAGPLAKLDNVHGAVREGRFFPDSSRSGRWVTPQ